MTSRGINYHKIGGVLYGFVFAYGDFNVVLVFLSKSDCMVSGSDLYVFSHCSAKKNFNFNCLHCNSIAINMNVDWLAYCAIDWCEQIFDFVPISHHNFVCVFLLFWSNKSDLISKAVRDIIDNLLDH